MKYGSVKAIVCILKSDVMEKLYDVLLDLIDLLSVKKACKKMNTCRLV